MNPWHSSSLTWFSLLTACLFGTVPTVDSNVAQLCAKWKDDTSQRFLAMGIITDAGGQSRFYAVSAEFEGVSVLAEFLHFPSPGNGETALVHPHIHLDDAEVLDLSSAKASWPQEGANGKGAFLLAFKPDSGLYSGEQFLAFFSKATRELFLASLTNPDAQVRKVSLVGDYPPTGAVFTADNKLTEVASVVASLRYVNQEGTGTFDAYLRRDQGDTLRIERLFHELPTQVKPSLAIDGGFLLLRANPNTEGRLIVFSNEQRTVNVFYASEETPLQVSFTDFIVCPEEGWLPNALKATGIAVPVIVAIGGVFFFMAKKKKNSGATNGQSGARSTVSVSTGAFTISGNSTAGSTAGKSTFNRASGKPSMMARSPAASSLGKFKTCTPVKPNKKPRTPTKKPRTANQRPSTLPGALARSMVSSPGPKAGVFKFKGAK